MNGRLATIERVAWGDGIAVRVTGEIDMSNVEELHDELVEELGSVESAALDLSVVRYVDSQGLRLLKRIADRLATSGVELTVIAPPETVAGQLLGLTQMGQYLRIVAE